MDKIVLTIIHREKKKLKKKIHGREVERKGGNLWW